MRTGDGDVRSSGGARWRDPCRRAAMTVLLVLGSVAVAACGQGQDGERRDTSTAPTDVPASTEAPSAVGAASSPDQFVARLRELATDCARSHSPDTSGKSICDSSTPEAPSRGGSADLFNRVGQLCADSGLKQTADRSLNVISKEPSSDALWCGNGLDPADQTTLRVEIPHEGQNLPLSDCQSYPSPWQCTMNVDVLRATKLVESSRQAGEVLHGPSGEVTVDVWMAKADSEDVRSASASLFRRAADSFGLHDS